MKKILHRKICITGATSGIGYQAIINLINQGHDLSILCRNVNRAEYLLNSLKRDNILESFIQKHISIYIADLSDINSVDEFIKLFISKNIFIDTLILNAGLQYTGAKNIT